MAEAAERGSTPGTSVPEPIIPGCTPAKYYQVPHGLKRLRRKQKVSIIFGYVGERYCGLQWNHLPEYPTVEEALLKALFETDMISEINFANVKVQQLLNFERASRTDKGVHALRNLVSVAIMLPYDPSYVEARLAASQEGVSSDHEKDSDEAHAVFSCEEAKRLLNLALPRDIHVYAVVPVTRSFNAYLNCGGRRYEYYLPTFALMEPSAYAQTYFPPSLAPSRPSLDEVGFVPGRQGKPPGCRAGNAATPLTEEEEEARRRRRANSARKSQGHFPKRKKAKAAARAAAAARGGGGATSTSGEPTVPVVGHHGAGGASSQRAEPKGEGEDAPDTASEGSEDSEAAMERAAAVAVAAGAGQPFEQNFATHFHDHLFESMMLFRTIPAEAMQAAAAYRLTAGQLQHVREVFHVYEGTHCYHNFTPGGRSNDASCHRFLRSITVSDPFIVQPDDALLQRSIDGWSLDHFYSPDERVAATYEEWVAEGMPEEARMEAATTTTTTTTTTATPAKEASSRVPEAVNVALRERMRAHIGEVYASGIEVVRIELDGQSFMLNQIRKMIGAVVCVTATGLPASHIRDVLLRKGVRKGIPMVPANGLFLAYLDFGGYNRRLERIQHDGHNGSGKGAIDVDAGVDAGEVEEQRRRIVAAVLRNEMAEDIMGKWMRSLRHVLRLAWQHEL